MSLQALLSRVLPVTRPDDDGYRAVKADAEAAPPGSSASSSPELSPRHSPRLLPTTPSALARSAALFVLGVLAASLVWGGVLSRAQERAAVVQRLAWEELEEAWQWGARRNETVGEERRYGPRRRRPTTWRGGFRTPGPRELLTTDEPGDSLYDALRTDLRYLIGDAWSGMTGQFLTSISLIYLAQRTQRIAIIPSPWRDGEHYHDTFAKMSDLFNLEQFRQDTGTLVLELSDVKRFDLEHKRTKREEIGCIHGPNFAHGGRTFEAFNLDGPSWEIERIGGWANDATESFILFDMDTDLRLKKAHAFAAKENRDVPRNMLDSQLLCGDNFWALSDMSMYRGGWGPHNYLVADGLQEKEGGMFEMLSPEARGTHPEWWAIGQYLDFQPVIWEVARLAARKTLGVDGLPRDLLTVHIRRGDFVTWCPSGHDCVPPLSAYRAAVASQLSHLPPDTPILVTTDDTSTDFLSSVRALGWFVVDHAALGTEALLVDRYGERSGWYGSAVDQAIHSLGSGFVGTEDSQVSLVAALRVAAWSGGRSEMVKRPK
ncbi:hypothetical protein JCM9279_001056 [Rhodotorula babjevae]